MADQDVPVNEQDEKDETAVEDQNDKAEGAGAEEGEEENLQEKLKKAIDVEVEDLGALRRRVTVTVPEELIQGQLSEQYDELKYEAMVPGFRKGRAPLKLIEKRFGSEVGEKVRANIVGASYLAAVEKESLDPLGDPLISVTIKEERPTEHGRPETVEVEKLVPVDEAIDRIELPKEGVLKYTCELEVRPEFKLPEVDKIPVKRPKVEVEPEDIDKELRRLMMFRATYRPVEGPIELDDLVIGNVKIHCGDVNITTQENAAISARDQLFGGLLLEGLGENLKGATAGKTISLNVPIPDDYEDVSLRGKEATFEMEVLDVKRLDVPKLDDEMAKQMGFDNEAEVREAVKSRMELQLSGLIQRGMEAQIDEYLLKKTEFEVPAGLSQRQTERVVARRMLELYREGLHESEITKRADELRAEAAEQVRKDLKLYFIMEKIAEELEIVVTEEEVNAAIAEIAQRRNRRFDRVRDELIRDKHLEMLYLQLRDGKVRQHLLANAEVTETEGPKKESAKPADKKGSKGKKKPSTSEE